MNPTEARIPPNLFKEAGRSLPQSAFVCPPESGFRALTREFGTGTHLAHKSSLLQTFRAGLVRISRKGGCPRSATQTEVAYSDKVSPDHYQVTSVPKDEVPSGGRHLHASSSLSITC
jgi:hypothetical protein